MACIIAEFLLFSITLASQEIIAARAGFCQTGQGRGWQELCIAVRELFANMENLESEKSGHNPKIDRKERGDMAKETEKRYCYAFEEGDGTNKKLLGGKGAGLCTMTQIGLPVPPGFCHHHRSQH